ncbi:B'ETA, partial [Symbiodinium sp. KB8]
VEPHEELKAQGLLSEFDESMGNAAFISHQWVGNVHPDPESKKLRVLQNALKHVLCGVGNIPFDIFTEMFFPRAKPVPVSDLQERRAGEAGSESSLASAIDSIPGYIARCKFFFALCPVVESESLGKVFTGLSWGERGWCRIERVLRELSPDPSWIMIKGNTELELTASSSACFIVQSAGEGQFTRKDDRTKLAQVLQHALRRKLRLLLMAEDLVGYRVHLNLQSIHLRGFPAEATDDLVPGFEPDSFEQDACTLSAQRFLYQNGFATVHEVDAGGWSPGHYAALRGDPLVMQGLLQLRADINRWTRKDQPLAGSTVGFTMLGTAAFFKHHQLMAGSRPFKKNLMGDSALEYAATWASLEGLEELLLQAGLSVAARVVFSAKSFQHRFGRRTLTSRWAYHRGHQTPLMAAVMSRQYEGAAALIAAGARLDLRNSRNWTAADFAAGQSVPEFLMEAFEGQLEGCQRVAALALANARVEV